MKNKKGFTLIELLVVIAIIAILAAILFPVFMRAKQAAMASHCQSNMNQIGKSIKMYLSDWEDTYPTQRLNPPLGTFIAPQIALSDPSLIGAGNEPIRYQAGVNWVEALYPYMEKVVDGDTADAWKCPGARTQKVGGNFAAVTYSFNANLIEMSEGVVKNAGNLLMLRELSAVYNSVLRPAAQTLSNAPAPSDVFLDGTEPGAPTPVKYKTHGDGSIILFADGHVKNFPTSYYPLVCQWDTSTNQWYNYYGNVPSHDPRNQSIAVSP
jgi:prepilin-type N-terminal cleavage/methylation domain-containing protein/prepilin-type processing-associated H-X9-DG protein